MFLTTKTGTRVLASSIKSYNLLDIIREEGILSNVGDFDLTEEEFLNQLKEALQKEYLIKTHGV